jgi:hypothetical protein
MDLVYPNYRELAGNFAPFSDLIVSTAISPQGDIYGIRNVCTSTNDVIAANPAVPEAVTSSEYTPVGAQQFVSGVFKPASWDRPWIALTDGFDVTRLASRFGETSRARLAYMYNVFISIFGAFCTTHGWCRSYNVPDGAPTPNAVRLAGNPARAGRPVLLLGLERADRVRVAMYDVAGRRVRTLVDRLFPAGEHRVVWDGADDHGRAVARGVYFARIGYASQGFERVSKMVVLR